MQHIVNIIRDSLAKGARFVSFRYRTKGTKELAQYTVALGISVESAYRRDRKILAGKLAHPMTQPQEQAARELLESLGDSLRLGIGANPRYTCAGVFEPICKGVKIHKGTNELEIFGFTIRKEVLEPGEEKPTKSKPVTIAKKELKQNLKSGKFRQFCLSGIRGAKINGNLIILDVDN